MGKLRSYTVSRRAAPTRAPEERPAPAKGTRKRTLGLALVASIGVAAGGGLGAALYHFDLGAGEDPVAQERVASAKFAAAAAAVFDTSPSKKETGDLRLNKVTADIDRVPTGTVKETDSKGLTWTADEDKPADLPNVVVVSSKGPVEEAAETSAAKPAPATTALSPEASEPTQSVIPGGTQLLAYAGSKNSFARVPAAFEQAVQAAAEPATAPAAAEPAVAPAVAEPAPVAAPAAPEPIPASAETVPARLLKQQIEARLDSSAARMVGEARKRSAADSAGLRAAENRLAIAGTRHFIALPETVESVEEAVALQNGWKTYSSAYVNMRTRPSSKGEVMTVIPAKAEFVVMNDCRRWCAIMYEGRKGYVYRTFVKQTKKPKVTVEVAETEAETIALETRMGAQDNQFFTPAQSTATFAAQLAADEGYRGAYATNHVNMRSEPKKGAPVLAIIPSDAEFMVEPVCKHWCGVVYKGQKGYVYRTYFQFTGKQG